VLVSNAGFSWFGPTADLGVATFDRLFTVNVRADAFGRQAAEVSTSGHVIA
jgi:short-subunit dehydrogenase